MSVPLILQINPRDNVGVATIALQAGTTVHCGGTPLAIRREIGPGGKVALADLPAGVEIIKFGEPIGTLTENVAAGGYIHTHNLKSNYLPTHARGDFVGGEEQDENQRA